VRGENLRRVVNRSAGCAAAVLNPGPGRVALEAPEAPEAADRSWRERRPVEIVELRI